MDGKRICCALSPLAIALPGCDGGIGPHGRDFFNGCTIGGRVGASIHAQAMHAGGKALLQ